MPDGSWVARNRRILVRRCYLNPQSFPKERVYFVRNGFETIDCPPLTAHGKTSADVHMVLDIVDFLSSGTSFDEFIIMSADADFTPVLLKLRKHDRRSIILATGPSSSAYTAASDLAIDPDLFRDFLGGELPPARGPQPAARMPTFVPGPSPSEFLTNHRLEISKSVRDLVARSAGPVKLTTLAASVRTAHPELSPQWGGCGTFSALLGQLELTNLERTTVGGGYLYDPDRHVLPAELPKSESIEELPPDEPETDVAAAPDIEKADALASEEPQLRELARRVSDVTNVPYLPPAAYAELFSALASEVNANQYLQMGKTSRAVRDELQRHGLPIGRTVLDFVLRCLVFSGHKVGKNVEVGEELAKAFYKNALNLCARNQLYLTKDEERLLYKWLVGKDDAQEQVEDEVS